MDDETRLKKVQQTKTHNSFRIRIFGYVQQEGGKSNGLFLENFS